jgi:hypothetical protein
MKGNAMKRLGWIVSVASFVAVVGCTDMSPRTQGTITGGALGAAGGAGISALVGGDAWTGAVIGGVAGSVAGNIHGGRQ